MAGPKLSLGVLYTLGPLRMGKGATECEKQEKRALQIFKFSMQSG